LVSDFENGCMTRRQLIQSLAMLTVVAAPSPVAASEAQSATQAASIPQAFEPTGWRTAALDHISYAVADYRRSVAFYRDLMGWTIRSDNGTTQTTLDINGLGEIIIRNRREPATATPGARPQSAGSPADGTTAQQGQGTRPPITGVINHVSWGIHGWDTAKVEAELKRRGLNPRPDMVGENFKSFHVLDPDGWDLQISNQTKPGA